MTHKPYQEILAEYGNRTIPYSIRLSSIEWQERREVTIKRAKNICEHCNEKCMDDWLLKMSGNFGISVPATYEDVIVTNKVFLHYEYIDVEETVIQLVEQLIPKIPNVHHKHYVLGRLPWEYSDDELMLVCHTCHKEIHETQQIKVYKSESKDNFVEVRPCSKCGGVGFLSEYNHFQGGVCFKCQGERFENILI